MKWKNKSQASNRLKLILDNYIQGSRLLNRGLELDYEKDSDIAEWTEEEISAGEGFVDVHSIEILRPKKLQFHDIVTAAELLDLPLNVRYRDDLNYPLELSIIYKDFELFEVFDRDKAKSLEGEEIVNEITGNKVQTVKVE